MSMKKIVLFGGTFDPIHLGHTVVAKFASEKIGADTTIFVPAKHSVLKAMSPHASDAHRYNMISLAISGSLSLEVSDYELKKASPCYTVETVKHFRKEFGKDCILYWLVGADSVRDLHFWYNIIELIDICELSVMYRADYEKPDFSKFESIWGASRIAKLEQNIVPTPLVPISSTKIREAITAGTDVSTMLDPAVAAYIKEHQLYQPTRI
jgi:nicotinate-nucleotide adenylyltransferase